MNRLKVEMVHSVKRTPIWPTHWTNGLQPTTPGLAHVRRVYRPSQGASHRNGRGERWTAISGWIPSLVRLFRPVLFAISLLMGLGPVYAARATINLGALTDATDQYHPLGYFRNAHAGLRTGVKPIVMFLGSQFDGGSTIERWAVVKALQQFGKFRGMAAMTTLAVCDPHVTDHCVTIPGPATPNITRASYASGYVVFDHKDLLDVRQKRLQSLSPTEHRIFMRFAYRKSPKGHSADAPNPYWTIMGPRWPVVVVGDFVETSPLGPVADLEDWQGRPYSFQQIQRALQQNDVQHFGSAVGPINAEANIISALICYQDREQPAAICGRPFIRSLLKHVR